MSSTAPHLVFETLEQLRLVVAYHSAEGPSDAEWEAWIDATDSLWKTCAEFRLLVISNGGHPSRRQVARLQSVKRRVERDGGKRRSEPLTAIVTRSVAMRFVVSGVALFNPKVRCYAPAAVVDAYAHLGLPRALHAAVDAAVERLRAKLASRAAAA